MRRFKILSGSAGSFTQGMVVTEEQIKDDSKSVDHWLGNGAIRETTDPPTHVTATANAGPVTVSAADTTPAILDATAKGKGGKK